MVGESSRGDLERPVPLPPPSAPLVSPAAASLSSSSSDSKAAWSAWISSTEGRRGAGDPGLSGSHESLQREEWGGERGEPRGRGMGRVGAAPRWVGGGGVRLARLGRAVVKRAEGCGGVGEGMGRGGTGGSRAPLPRALDAPARAASALLLARVRVGAAVRHLLRRRRQRAQPPHPGRGVAHLAIGLGGGGGGALALELGEGVASVVCEHSEEAEVSDLRDAVLVEQHVRRLQVAVGDRDVERGVQILHPARQVAHPPQRLQSRVPRPAELVAERAARHELLDQHHLPVLLLRRPQRAHDVLVAQPDEQRRLGVELRLPRRRRRLQPRLLLRVLRVGRAGDELLHRLDGHQHRPVLRRVAREHRLRRLRP